MLWLIHFPYVGVRGRGRPLEPSRPPSAAVAAAAVATVAILIADDVGGDGAVGELLAVVELVGRAATLAVLQGRDSRERNCD